MVNSTADMRGSNLVTDKQNGIEGRAAEGRGMGTQFDFKGPFAQ